MHPKTPDKISATGEHRDDPSLDRLLHDLQELPKVDAPLNFESSLMQRIDERARWESLPWYKKMFSRKSGEGFRLPAFAYGSVALIAVCIVGYYTIQSSRILEPQIDELRDNQPSQPVESDVKQTTTSASNETDKRQLEGSRDQKPNHEFYESRKNIEQITPSVQNETRSTTPPPPPSAAPMKSIRMTPLPSEKLKDVKLDAPSMKEQLAPRPRGIILDDESAAESKALLDTAAFRKDSLNRLDSVAKAGARKR